MAKISIDQMRTRILQIGIILFCIFLLHSTIYAQEDEQGLKDATVQENALQESQQEQAGSPIDGQQGPGESIWRAKVEEVLIEEQRHLPGLNITSLYQSLRAQILEGPRENDIAIVENDYIPLRAGDKFFLSYLVTINGDELYTVKELDRKGAIYFFMALFVLVILVFGGLQGLRSLIGLAGSFFVILYFILPKLLAGASPMLTSIAFSILILVFAIYVTHGINRKSSAALAGTIITIVLSAVLAHFAVVATKLSGFIEDSAVFLNLQTGGRLNFQGLLLGAIIIGTLGILDDISITQTSAVEEIVKMDKKLSHKEVYARAMRIGKDHVGAIVNTLALAYAGAALPLLLLFYDSGESPVMILNREIFATEIIRTIVGSIGIILAVPITTAIAIMLIAKTKPQE